MATIAGVMGGRNSPTNSFGDPKNTAGSSIFRTGTISTWQPALTTSIRAKFKPKVYIDLNPPEEQELVVIPICAAAGMRWQNQVLTNYEQPYRLKQKPTPQDYAHAYHSLLLTHGERILSILEKLLFSRQSLLFGCWLGKDRTGVIAALGELYLGHPEARIVENFLQSNTYLALSPDVLEPLARKRGLGFLEYQRRIEAHQESLTNFFQLARPNIADLFYRLDRLHSYQAR